MSRELAIALDSAALNLPHESVHCVTPPLTMGFRCRLDDLSQLLNRATLIAHDRITVACVAGFGFLANLADAERILAQDKYGREPGVGDALRAGL